MCGRYVLLRPDIRALLKRLRLEELVASLTGDSRYNIGPSQRVLGIRQSEAGPTGLEVAPLTWGMKLPSSEAPDRTHFVVNARSENVAQRPAFRGALAERRCALPASGFYEWRRSASGSEPWLFRLEQDEPFFLAGLWDSADAACVVLTTSANECMDPIHDRMPVLLTPDDAEQWLGPAGQSEASRRRLFRPFAAERMRAVRVDTRVNDARNEGPECMQPWNGPEKGEQAEFLM
ncbi:hypothetical protein DB347_22845 [Opitutaceae bacterium EW11]|nr:hypothetical protein DB347_22845 [Opitutaceae bacterium EW11]